MEEDNIRVVRKQRDAKTRATVDAPAGDCHRRTAAGPPAAPKLVRKTFLVDHTESNLAPSATPGAVWSVKIHDFGKQWVEAWGKVDPCPGKRGFKGESAYKEQNEKRAQAQAKGEIRRKCLSIGADHLVTLTHRDNVEDRERVLTDLERLHRMLSRVGYPMPYVAVLECQQCGAIHPHLAVRGFQDIRLLRRCWYKIVGRGTRAGEWGHSEERLRSSWPDIFPSTSARISTASRVSLKSTGTFAR